MASEALGTIRIFKPTRVLLLLALCLRMNVNANAITDKTFCPDGAIVDLTVATWNGTGFFAESSQFFPYVTARYRKGMLLGCVCDIEPCVLLCPSSSEENSTEVSEPEYVNNTLQEILFMRIASLISGNDENQSHVFVWDACMGYPGQYVKRYIDDSANQELYLLKNGSVYGSDRYVIEGLRRSWRRYCLTQEPNGSTYSVQHCMHGHYGPEESEDDDPPLHPFLTALGVGFVLSVPFLIATIFVYSVLPDLKNMYGNTVRCYLCCLLATYITIGAGWIFKNKLSDGATCLIYGYVLYFFLYTSFLWLNVMCFDMWWKFRGYGSSRSGGKQQDRKRFIGYSIYAWGIATVSVVMCISLDYSQYLPDSILTPDFNDQLCWFGNFNASILYLFGPVGVTIVCNVYFFVLMTLKLVRHRRNTQRQLDRRDSQRHDVNNTASFVLHLKLFVIMGVSWAMLIVSVVSDTDGYFMSFSIMIIMLQGVLIFLVFVCKKNIWKSLKMRLRCCRNSNDADATQLSRFQTSSRFLSNNSSVQT